MKGMLAVTGLVALSCVLMIACGGGSSASSSAITPAEVTDFMSTVAGSAVNALGTAAAAKDVLGHNLKDMPARILNGKFGRNAKVKEQKLQVQCNPTGTSCTFSDNFNVAYSCQTGGTMSIAGTLTGTGTQNSAYLSMEIEVSPNSWTCDGPMISGDPYVQINGTYDYPADTATMTMSGAFIAGTQTCQLNVTVNGNADGSGDISGTACGDGINASF